MEATDLQTRVIVQTAYEKMMARGRAEGEARGETRGKADMLVRLVEARFGSVSPKVVARIRRARVAQLDRWAQRLFTASAVDDLFVD